MTPHRTCVRDMCYRDIMYTIVSLFGSIGFSISPPVCLMTVEYRRPRGAGRRDRDRRYAYGTSYDTLGSRAGSRFMTMTSDVSLHRAT